MSPCAVGLFTVDVFKELSYTVMQTSKQTENIELDVLPQCLDVACMDLRIDILQVLQDSDRITTNSVCKQLKFVEWSEYGVKNAHMAFMIFGSLCPCTV